MELPLVKFDIAKADLQAFAGAYRSEELDVTYTVALLDSSLVVESTALHSVYKDAFVGEYVGMVRFQRDARGTVAGFTLNRNSARGVRFDRLKMSRLTSR